MTHEAPSEAHPLVEMDLSVIERWEDWERLWAETEQVEMLHSLLHFGFGFRVRDNDEAQQRVCTYLRIADGHDEITPPWEMIPREWNPYANRQHDHRTILGRQISPEHDLKRLLARKAFEVLCHNFFKNTAERNNSAPSWARLLVAPEILKEVLFFFRMKEGIYSTLSNLHNRYDEDHHTKIARTFVFELCKFSWNCANSNMWHRGEIPRDMVDTLKEAQPDMITLLYGLGELQLLLASGYELDELCMQRLEELTMNQRLSLPSVESWNDSFRTPVDLDEALFGGSRAAIVLLMLQRSKAVHKRFEEARRLKQVQREAEEGLRQLEQSAQ